jgi:hypothetical protein
MKRYCAIGLATLLGIEGAACSSFAQQEAGRRPMLGAHQPASSEMLDAQVVEGLKISLDAAQGEFEAGERLSLPLTFENVSRENLRVFLPISRIADEYFEVRVNGPSVWRRPFVARNMMAFLPGPQAFPELKPGEKRTFEFVISGNPPRVSPGHIVLGAPGEYQIQVVYAYQGAGPEPIGRTEKERLAANFEPWRGRVISAPIKIRVKGEVQPIPAEPGRLHGEPRPLQEAPGAATPRVAPGARRTPGLVEEESP